MSAYMDVPHKDAYQHTLRRPVRCTGVGLHSGRQVEMEVVPAPENSGIRFFRSDLDGCGPIPASIDRVVDTRLATTIGINCAVRVATTEHLLAALRGLEIDNADIHVNAPEIPIMDGSAAPFVRLMGRAGRRRQSASRKVMRILRPVEYRQGSALLRVEPHDGFKISGRIAFRGDLISEQQYEFTLSPERFRKEIARARTFGFVDQVEQLWENGLAQGCSLENVVAINWNGDDVLNEDGLRFDDEFIRHKVLDLIGDLALLGHPLQAHVTAEQSGHSAHLGLMQAILDDPDCYEIVDLRPMPAPRQQRASVPFTRVAGAVPMAQAVAAAS